MPESWMAETEAFEAPEIDSSERPPDTLGILGALELAGMIAALLALQAVLVYLLMSDRWSLTTTLGAHVAITAVVAGWAFAPKRTDPRLHATLAVASGLAFIFGTIGTGVAFVTRELGLRTRLGGAGWYALLFPSTSLSRSDRLARDARHRNRRARLAGAGPGEVAPLMDVLDNGSTSARIEIVAFLGRHFQPRYAPVLRRALGDPDPAIRAQAAGVAAGLERRLADALQRAHRAYEEAPDDRGRARDLAELYDDFAHAGLLSAVIADTYRARAFELYEGLLDADPADGRARVRVLRLLLRIDRVGEALAHADALAATSPDLADSFPWLAEAYYRGRRYADLRRLCADRVETAVIDHRVPFALYAAVQFWAGVRGGTSR